MVRHWLAEPSRSAFHLIRRTTIRPRDRLICVIQQMLRTPAAYPDLGRDPSAGFPTLGITNLRAPIVGFVTRDRLQRRAAYPDAYSFQGGRQAHGPNTRSAGLLTAAGPRFRTWVYITVVVTSRCPSSSWMRTTGSRSGRRARTMPSSHGRSTSSTSLYRNRRALNA